MTNTILCRMKSIASIFIFIFCLFLSDFATAQSNQKGYCKKAQSTADLVVCIGEHNKHENNHMDLLFKKIIDLQTDKPDFQTELQDSQNEWITYRDDVCKMEGDVYEGKSLKHVQGLACLARLTSNRSDHYKAMMTAFDYSQIPEFSYIPRWVNVLSSDHKNVFWQYATNQPLDTDCDGVAENMIQGVRQNEKGYEMVLAIADSQETGRPKITIINFDDQKDCKITNEYKIIRLPIQKPVDGVIECIQKIEIETENCGTFLLNTHNHDYILEKKENNDKN